MSFSVLEMTEEKEVLKLGSLNFSGWILPEGVPDADSLPEFFVYFDLIVKTEEILGPTCWKNFGMTGRQLMTIPVESSA